MPKSSLSLALLCAAAGELAQSQTPTPAAVSGAITNSVTGAPIPRVHVVLHPDDQRHFYGALSDGDGRSTIASVAPGHYSVEMQRTGFLTPLDAGANRFFELTAGQKKDLSLTLLPSGSISGQVLDAAGEPMESISVTAEGGWSGMNSVNTDNTGRFRLSGLSPGKYRVRASPMNLPFRPNTAPTERRKPTTPVHTSPLP